MDRFFRALGPLEVEVAGEEVDLGGSKPKALLATLVARRNRPVSTEALIDALWGEQAPATAHKSIHKYISLLRRQLGDVLVTRGGGYQLQVADSELDAAILETAIHGTDQGAARESALAEALSLWRGDPYPELADTAFGQAEATRLGELRLEGVETLMQLRLSRGGHTESIADLEDLVAKHPLRERLWALLMLALYRSGRQSDALRAFQRLRTLLVEELGIEPSPELARLEEQILAQDPDLDLVEAVASHNLPAPLTSFVGRASEMDEIVELLAGNRLVTLLGPAGSGKTRLAIEVGRSLRSGLGGAVWFVDLARVRSPEQVATTVCDVLGVGLAADRSAEQVLSGYLASRRLLLILDNCEHLIARVSELAAHLLAGSPELRMVATSRERLGIGGEVIFDVSPLPYPTQSEPVSEDFDAVRLFMERARAVNREVTLQKHGQLVGEVVRRLDGIPLALELAAARTRSLGLEELRDRLDDRFSILAGPARAGDDRHQTLHAAIDWSYRLLNSSEQTLFARLSVFRGGFDLSAATSVCGYEPLEERDVMALLAELIDKSLVSVSSVRADRRRYHLLESLREFGQELPEATGSSRLRDSHAAYYLGLAEEAAGRLSGPGQTEAIGVLRLDHDNMRKALRWASTTSPQTAVRLALALSRFWDAVGPRAEGHEWLTRAVELSRGLDPGLHIAALVQASDLFSSVNAALPRRYAEEALAVARSVGDEMGEARALRALSWALSLDEQPDQARETGLEALRIFERHGDPWELALCLERVGQGTYADPEWSIQMLRRALELYRQVGDRTREALALYKIAERLAHTQDGLGPALEHAERAVAICDEIGNAHDGAHARLELGKILTRVGDHTTAQYVLEQAREQLAKSGDDRCTVRAMTALGLNLIAAGDDQRAEGILQDSLRRGRELDEKHTSRAALAGLAGVMSRTGCAEDAVRLLGYVDELGVLLGVPASQASLQKRREELSELSERVGAGFDRLWEEGHHFDLEEAISLALGSTVG